MSNPMVDINQADVELHKLLEATTLSSVDGFSRDRRPQYKPSNESPAQKSRPVEPAPTPTVSVHDDAEWDVIRSNESTVDGKASTSGYTATHRRPVEGFVDRHDAASFVDDMDVDDDDDGGNSHQLTALRLRMLDVMNNQLSVQERIMLQQQQQHDSQAKHSVAVKRTTTRVSESTVDMMDAAYSPAGLPEPDIFAVGAWADAPMPPMA